MPEKKVVLLPGERNNIVITAKGPDPAMRFRTDFEMQPFKMPVAAGMGMGIEETLDVVDFGVSFANGFILTFEDGKFVISEVVNFIPGFMKFPKAFSGIELVPLEVDDIDQEELDQIVAFVISKIDVTEEHALNIIRKSIRAVHANYELVKAVLDARSGGEQEPGKPKSNLKIVDKETSKKDAKSKK